MSTEKVTDSKGRANPNLKFFEMADLGNAKSPNPKKVKILLEGTYDKLPEVAAEALRSLERIGAHDWKTYDLAAEISNDKLQGPAVISAAEVLEWHITRDLENKMEVLNLKPSKNVKIAAMNVLAEAGYGRARSSIAELTKSGDQTLSEAAKKALARMDEIEAERMKKNETFASLHMGSPTVLRSARQA